MHAPGISAAARAYVPSYPTISGGWLQREVLNVEQTYRPLDLAAALQHRRLAALDFETTGFDVAGRWGPPAAGIDRPTQVAVLPFDGSDLVLTGPALVGLVDPCRPISPAAEAITGIGDAQVAGAPTWAQMLPRIIGAIGTRTLVVHNAAFDIEALRDMIDTVQDPARSGELPPGTPAASLRARLDALGAASGQWLPPGGVVDTLPLARAVFGPAGRGPDGEPRRGPGEPEDDRLGTLARHFGVEHGAAHDAAADARAAIGVLYHLLAAGTRRGTVIDHYAEQARFDRAATNAAAQVARFRADPLDGDPPAAPAAASGPHGPAR